MFHEIAPRRFDNSFVNREADESDCALIYNENGIVLVKEGEYFRFPLMKEVQAKHAVSRYAFAIDGQGYFIVLGDDIKVQKSTETVGFTDLRNIDPMYIGFAGMLGKQLYRFFHQRKYCGCCGTKTHFSDTEQAIICPSCHHVEYPKISPAIIVAIVNEDKLLMTKYAYGNYKKYALVAGFVEFGESFEEAVKREVKEEVGLNVKNVKYFKNQPWPFSDSQMVGFFAELDGDDKVTLQEEELSEAVWFTREEIPRNDNSVSISYELIEAVRSGDVTYYLNSKYS